MADDKKNVFISHVHEDDAGLGAMKDLLKQHGLEIRDSSINSANPNNAKSPDYIKSEILAPQINWASTLLIYITPKTKNSEWVNWEIDYAHRQGKRIVGVWANGHSACEIPDALNDYADAVVNWKGEQIVDAINGKNMARTMTGRTLTGLLVCHARLRGIVAARLREALLEALFLCCCPRLWFCSQPLSWQLHACHL